MVVRAEDLRFDPKVLQKYVTGEGAFVKGLLAYVKELIKVLEPLDRDVKFEVLQRYLEIGS